MKMYTYVLIILSLTTLAKSQCPDDFQQVRGDTNCYRYVGKGSFVSHSLFFWGQFDFALFQDQAVSVCSSLGGEILSSNPKRLAAGKRLMGGSEEGVSIIASASINCISLMEHFLTCTCLVFIQAHNQRTLVTTVSLRAL